MKRNLFIAFFMVISVSLFAQNDITKFLGIPIDGFKPQMIEKLKAKGFVSSSIDKDVLEGEFNGKNVELHVVTNNNKVYRIVVSYMHRLDEGDIKIEFNNLYRQFKNNKKYAAFDDCTIPEEENISYEMAVNNKRYQASFYQKPNFTDTLAFQTTIQEKLFQKYTKQEIEDMSEEEVNKELFSLAMSYAEEAIFNKSVWFMISEMYGKYHIVLYYDNGYNKANGEDL